MESTRIALNGESCLGRNAYITDNCLVITPRLDVSELRTQESTSMLGKPRPLSFYMLGHQLHSVQGIQSLAERLAVFRQGNLLFHSGTDPEELAHFIERTAEA